MRDLITFYTETVGLAVAVYRATQAHPDPVHSNEGAVMDPNPNTFDPFDRFADAVERAVHRYRNADAQHVDRADARNELIALCDVVAQQPRAKRQPDPDLVAVGERKSFLDSVRDRIANRNAKRVGFRDPVRQPVGALRNAERQPVHDATVCDCHCHKPPFDLDGVTVHDGPCWLRYQASTSGQ